MIRLRLKPELLTLLFISAILSRILRIKAIVAVAAFIVFAILLMHLLEMRKSNSDDVSHTIVFASLALLWSVAVTLSSSYEISARTRVAEIAIWFLYFAIGISISKLDDNLAMTRSLLQIERLIVLFVVVGFVMQFILRIQFATDTQWGDTNIYAPFATKPVVDPLHFRMRSVFSHPIIFANISLVAMVIIVFLEEQTVLIWVKLSILTIGLVLSGTRGAWLAFVVILLFVIWSNRNRLNRSWHLIVLFAPLLFLGALYLINSFIADRVLERVLTIQDDGSYANRVAATQYIISLMANDPVGAFFGHGASASKTAVMPVFPNGWDVVDNQWISMLFDFGLIPFLVILVASIFCFFKGLIESSPVSLALSLGVILPSMIGMFFYEMFTWHVPALLFFVSLGWMLGRPRVSSLSFENFPIHKDCS